MYSNSTLIFLWPRSFWSPSFGPPGDQRRRQAPARRRRRAALGGERRRPCPPWVRRAPVVPGGAIRGERVHDVVVGLEAPRRVVYRHGMEQHQRRLPVGREVLVPGCERTTASSEGQNNVMPAAADA